MDIYTIAKEASKKVSQFDSNFTMMKILIGDGKYHIGCMYLDANGVVGYHQASVPQLLLILEGEGIVRGKENVLVHVRKGDAVFWDTDEWHEAYSASGLNALVIEGEGLDPSRFMEIKVNEDLNN